MSGIHEKSSELQIKSAGPRLDLSPSGAVLTTREVCAYLHVSKWTLYRLIESGQLKTMKIGTRRLIRWQSLEAYMDEKEAERG